MVRTCPRPNQWDLHVWQEATLAKPEGSRVTETEKPKIFSNTHHKWPHWERLRQMAAEEQLVIQSRGLAKVQRPKNNTNNSISRQQCLLPSKQVQTHRQTFGSSLSSICSVAWSILSNSGQIGRTENLEGSRTISKVGWVTPAKTNENKTFREMFSHPPN